MNNKKEHFKKVAAFVSALSFLAVSNYGAVNSVAAEIISEQITKTTAFDNSDNDNNQDNTDKDDSNNDDSGNVTQTTTSQSSVTETTTTTTTAMVVQKQQIISVSNQEKTDYICTKIKNELQEYNLQEY
ncbi:MAG: hypothetical protein K2F73_06795, partial [Ruminococcus sp.]|nr:hypothetical protein [Ruminococcus sp.]